MKVLSSTSLSGTISSIGYPEFYKSSKCIYTFQGPRSDRVAIKFLDFDLDSGDELR